jgi:hypothetical protein
MGGGFMKTLLAGAVVLALGGCGGGAGGDDDRLSNSSYTVYARTPAGALYSVCIDGIDPPPPASPQGVQVTNVLMDYYDLVGVPQVVTSFELSCIEVDPQVNQIVTIEEYNRVILPTVLGSKPPAAL